MRRSKSSSLVWMMPRRDSAANMRLNSCAITGSLLVVGIVSSSSSAAAAPLRRGRFGVGDVLRLLLGRFGDCCCCCTLAGVGVDDGGAAATLDCTASTAIDSSLLLLLSVSSITLDRNRAVRAHGRRMINKMTVRLAAAYTIPCANVATARPTLGSPQSRRRGVACETDRS